MKLAVYLAKEVAAILRAVLTHETKSCTMTVRCTCFAPITGYSRFTRNYCTHRLDTMLPGKEKENDPAVAWQGLQRIPTHPNSGSHRLLALASVTGLEVLVMLTPYRSGFRPTGMDQEVAPVDIRKQWQEARANRRMQFKVGNYRDGSWESNIRMLTGTIKVDWIQLPVEQYLAALPTLKQGVIAGVFRQKGAAGELLGRRSCNSQFSSPMICLWRIGMQGLMAYQLLAGGLYDGC